jgi:hypothetical protein
VRPRLILAHWHDDPQALADELSIAGSAPPLEETRPELFPPSARSRALTPADLADLETQLADLAAAAEDQTRPLGRRRLGRRTARSTIREAFRKSQKIIANATGGAS